MIETFEKLPHSSAELKRIEIASKTLSRIYDDLTYLSLNHNYHRVIAPLDISHLLHERILYFEAMIEAKSLKLTYDIEPDVVLEIDRNDALRLIDNLLSNAIKYNRPGGLLHVELNQSYFLVKDSGIGIDREDLASVKKRFKRANKSEGGFGIGLNIVDQVVRNYGFGIEIDSKENIGTEVWIRWLK
jgi:two-component system OmpR family sensor kinase